MAISAPELSPSPLLLVSASPSAGEAAAVLHFSGDAPRHWRHGRPSATASHPARVALWSASGHPATSSRSGEGWWSPYSRRPALPWPPAAG
ncbi:hypothetical protein D1007_59230 [Hordeum vulgare]|nr:hypothetical protein D1007_59230 [Hordeum vulgare]